MNVENWFASGTRWPNCGPLVAAKWLKMVVFDHHLKKYSNNPIQIWFVHLLVECSEMIRFWIQLKFSVYTYWVSVQNWFAFGTRWPNCVPLVATTLLKMMVFDHHLKKCSHNPIQTWSVYLLGKCSEMIRFWDTLAKFWPSFFQKMTVNGGFRGRSDFGEHIT